ncbi:molecular chaperone [Salmonella enterica subsp. enterica serovar Aqua]|nr:molecular chaperone [Salmonella enterica subsp. enterica serovar Aqua]
MRVFYVTLLCFSSLFSCVSHAETGGISLAATRVILSSDKNSAGLTVNNSSNQDSWLLRSWVTPYYTTGVKNEKIKTPVPFVITPPLYRIEPDGKVQLRINAVDVSSLPADRESVFRINVMAIPPETKINRGKEKAAGELSGGHIQFAINNQIKLFYRPAGLNEKSGLDRARKQLIFSLKGNTVDVNNPTPYFFTLVNIRVNGRPLSDEKKTDTMVAPFSHLQLPVSDARSMEYQTINDYGGNTDAEKVTF